MSEESHHKETNEGGVRTIVSVLLLAAIVGGIGVFFALRALNPTQTGSPPITIVEDTTTQTPPVRLYADDSEVTNNEPVTTTVDTSTLPKTTVGP